MTEKQFYKYKKLKYKNILKNLKKTIDKSIKVWYNNYRN